MKRLTSNIFSKFKELMQEQLKANNHKSPDVLPYEGFYIEKLHYQIDMLIIAIHSKNKKEIIHRAVNVANYVMFIAYWYGSMLGGKKDE